MLNVLNSLDKYRIKDFNMSYTLCIIQRTLCRLRYSKNDIRCDFLSYITLPSISHTNNFQGYSKYGNLYKLRLLLSYTAMSACNKSGEKTSKKDHSL